MTNVIIDNILLSFGHGEKSEKKKILNDHPHHEVFMDLTCFNPEEFYAEFKNLKGSFSALFADQNKKIEIHFRNKNLKVFDYLKELGFTAIEVSFASTGFIFPRTIVQIINEAFFALEEKVASSSDIDRAMKFGVNYPKGPFEWAQGREDVVLTLLNELYIETKDKRYLASKLIQSKS